MTNGTGNFRNFQISRKKDNLERWTEIFETNFRKPSVPFDFEPEFPEILVEWNAPSISALKGIDERNGWFNRHNDKGGSNVNYQHIKPAINKAIDETFKGENANLLRWLLSSRLQDGGPDTYPQQNSGRVNNKERTKLKQIMHPDKKQQQTVQI